MNWINVKNSREHINKGWVLVYCDQGVYRYTIARFDTGRGWKDIRDLTVFGVTHFMPLPDAPTDVN